MNEAGTHGCLLVFVPIGDYIGITVNGQRIKITMLERRGTKVRMKVQAPIECKVIRSGHPDHIHSEWILDPRDIKNG